MQTPQWGYCRWGGPWARPVGALAPRVTEVPGPLSLACHHHPSAHSYIPRRDRAAGLPRGTAVTHSTEQRVPEGQLTSFSLGVRVEISSHQITGSPTLGRRCLYYPHFTQRNRQRACTEAQRQLQTGTGVTRRGIQVSWWADQAISPSSPQQDRGSLVTGRPAAGGPQRRQSCAGLPHTVVVLATTPALGPTTSDSLPGDGH